jgi:hypothetical protein
VYALFKLGLNFLKVKSGIEFIVAMTVNTIIIAFHPQLTRMGEGIVFGRMTIGTCKTSVVGCVKIIPGNQPVFTHDCGYIHLSQLVVIGVF